MLENPREVVRSLEHFDDLWSLAAGSITLRVGSSRTPSDEPFHPGFIDEIEERRELSQRMLARLNERERLLLVLWYVSSLKPCQVAERIGVSRPYCYQLRRRAIDALCGETEGT